MRPPWRSERKNTTKNLLEDDVGTNTPRQLQENTTYVALGRIENVVGTHFAGKFGATGHRFGYYHGSIRPKNLYNANGLAYIPIALAGKLAIIRCSGY
jgi:hypothetical protein